jgi:hypothetical protein
MTTSHVPADAPGCSPRGSFAYSSGDWRELQRAPSMSVYRYAPAAGVLLLIAAAWPDHRAAAIVHHRAANLSRSLVEQIRTLAPPDRGPVNLTLVDMHGHNVERGLIAATFANGLVELARLTSPAVAAIELSASLYVRSSGRSREREHARQSGGAEVASSRTIQNRLVVSGAV